MNENAYNSLEDFLETAKSMRVVNAIGTMSYLGGNTVSNELIESMKIVNSGFVKINDLLKLAGEYISKKIGVEAVCITSGTAAGIVLGISSLIYLKSGFKDIESLIYHGREMYVAVQRPHKTEFRDLVSIAGPKIIEFGDRNEVTEASLADTISKLKGKVLAILHYQFEPMDNSLPLKSVLKVAHSYGVPVIVDAAAELPPKDNLTKYYNMGSDLVLFSGGKMLGGLSNSGLMIGKKEIIDATYELGPTSEEMSSIGTKIFIGRPMKISKETIVSTVVALENFLKFDENEWLKEIYQKAKIINEKITSIDANLSVKIVNPKWYHPRPATVPRVEIKFNNGMSAEEVSVKLKNYEIPIYTYIDDNKLYVNPQCLTNQDLAVLIDGFSNVLAYKREEERWKN